MKAWPEDDKSVTFDDLVDPFVAAMRFAYKLERRNADKDIPYAGLDIGDHAKACSPSPDERLKAENLEYEEEDQGRDALDVILGLAMQIGIEQGRRIQVTEDNKTGGLRWKLKTARMFLDE